MRERKPAWISRDWQRLNHEQEKVKCAALSMQRYDWEQGVVAQAFLEAGDHDTAILLAIEAAHRQDKYGRCAAIGESFSATDPCAIGEALIYEIGRASCRERV